MNMLWPGIVEEFNRVVEHGYRPRARKIPKHLKDSLEKQLQTVAVLSESVVKDPKALFVTRWQPLLKRFAGERSFQLLYIPFLVLLRCFTAVVVATVRGFMQGFLLVGGHALHVIFLAFIMPYKNRLRNIKQLGVACLQTFVLLVASIEREDVWSRETNHAATEFTLVVVLIGTGAIELISPLLGTLRAWIGMLLLARGGESAPAKFFVGAARTRSALFLHPRALRSKKAPLQRLKEYARLMERSKQLRENLKAGAPLDQPHNMSVIEALKAVDKWMHEHVVPCIIACCAARAKTFCAEHMESDDALKDVQAADTAGGFLALSKERFTGMMLETALRVLPDAEEAHKLLEHHVTAAEQAREREHQRHHMHEAKAAKSKKKQKKQKRGGLECVVEGVRSTRQATPLPPWIDIRTRKHVRKRVVRKGWLMAETLWNKAERALKGQILTREPGTMVDESGVVKEREGELVKWEFEIEEAELLAIESSLAARSQDHNEQAEDFFGDEEKLKVLDRIKRKITMLHGGLRGRSMRNQKPEAKTEDGDSMPADASAVKEEAVGEREEEVEAGTQQQGGEIQEAAAAQEEEKGEEEEEGQEEEESEEGSGVAVGEALPDVDEIPFEGARSDQEGSVKRRVPPPLPKGPRGQGQDRGVQV